MRICFLTYNLFGLGGIQRVVSVLASELCKYYDVYIQCYDNPEDENRETYGLSSEVKVIYKKRSNKSGTLRKLARKVNQKYGLLVRANIPFLYEYAYILPEEQQIYKDVIRENGIDIAIAVGGFESYLLGSIADEVDCKTVGWQHNSYKAYFETPGMSCWGMDYIVEKYFPKLDSYVVLNEYDEEEFLKKKNFKCKTIHNPKSFVSSKTAELTNPRFIAAGRFIHAKGFDLLLKAFEIFCEKNSEWTLSIYGEGEQFEDIKEAVEKANLQDRILLPGYSDKMTQNMLESSCYLLSSRWEGMPMVILEALEAGLPIVSFDISAMIPLVTNNIEGLIVPQFDCEEFADAMLQIASNKELREKMGTAGKNKAKEFNADRIAQKWIELFETL